MALSKFSAALEHHKAEISQAQYWRYKGGRLPRLLTWLASKPDLAQALADDARELASQAAQQPGKGVSADAI